VIQHHDKSEHVETISLTGFLQRFAEDARAARIAEEGVFRKALAVKKCAPMLYLGRCVRAIVFCLVCLDGQQQCSRVGDGSVATHLFLLFNPCMLPWAFTCRQDSKSRRGYG